MGDYTFRQKAADFLESEVHGGVTTMISAGEPHFPGRPKDAAGAKAQAIFLSKCFRNQSPLGAKIHGGALILEQGLVEADPERLVMTNGYDKTSVLAYVTDVNATETCAGVYDVTVKLTEYRKPVVRTTGVPAITRPGKIPEMPKTMTFPNASAVGEDALRRSQAQTGELMNELAHTLGMTYTWINTRGDVESTKNPNLVPTNTPVTTIGNQPKDLTLGSYLTDSRAKQSSGTGYGLMTNQGGSWPSKTFDAMDKAINEFSKKSLKERGII